MNKTLIDKDKLIGSLDYAFNCTNPFNVTVDDRKNYGIIKEAIEFYCESNKSEENKSEVEDCDIVDNDPSKIQIGGTHYKEFEIDPVELCVRDGLDFLQGNAIKYIMRYDKKGSPRQDLEKAKHYIDLLIKWKVDGKNE